MEKLFVYLIIQLFLIHTIPIMSSKIPDTPRQRRQTFHRNPDGSITATFAASEAFKIPGSHEGASFGVAETINFGPKGFSVDGGQSFSSNIGGNKMAFGQSNSQNSRFGPGGFSSNGANSMSNSFQNPFFQTSNANANANAFNQQQPWG